MAIKNFIFVAGVFLLIFLTLSCSKNEDYTNFSNKEFTDLAKQQQQQPHKLRNIICEPSPIDLLEGCACFAPPENCLLTVVIWGRTHMINEYASFKSYLANDNIAAYFSNSTSWYNLFPFLKDNPDVINDIIRRSKVMVEVGVKNTNEEIFVVVDYVNKLNFKESDIIYAFPFEI